MCSAIALLCVLMPGADPRDVLFESRIRPLLIAHCNSCHGLEKQKGQLRLDSAQAFAKGGESGPLIHRDHPEKSPILIALSHTADLKMPPKGKLPPKDIQALEAWIRSGAEWPKGLSGSPDSKVTAKTNPSPWWAKKPFDPLPKNPKATRSNPIDSFLSEKRAQIGVTEAPTADRRTLLRRMTFDLTGLPPTPKELAAFLANPSPDAVAKQIDKLLDSPEYGEKWARKWLDISRYADSNGMDENLSHALAWKYRDWVIKAFQRDLPYDQFVAMQIAGDLLTTKVSDEAAKDRLVATGFLSIGPKMLAEDDPVKMRMDIIDEQLDTLGQAFLGLTLGCARCHDHKFDPISTRDYYGLAGIFHGTDTMETYSVVARWMERPHLGPDEEKAFLAKKKNLEADLKAQQDLKSSLRKKEIEIHLKRAGAYALAAKQWNDTEATSPKEPPKQALILEAEDYIKGNLIKDIATYGKGIGVLVNRGDLPNRAEYASVSLPVGWVRIWTRHAAQASRPVKLFVNDKLLTDSAANQVTGSWTPESQRWHIAATTKVVSGKWILRLESAGPVPHIDKFALEVLPSEVALAQTLGAFADSQGLHPLVLERFSNALKTLQGKPWVEQWNHLVDLQKGPLKDEPALDPLILPATLAEANRAIAKIEESLKEIKTVPQVMAVREGKPTDLKVHIRGSHLSLGESAPRGFPTAIRLGTMSPFPKDQSGRLQLAQWITQPNHPLTARVMVNRIWQGHFGKGIVRSVDNFGNLGELPFHPELLDWLAAKFVESNWSIKAMHRLIMNTAAYQSSMRMDEAMFQADPDNRTLWRFERRRLEAEEFRDAMLFVSNTLDKKAGGTLLTIGDRQYVTSTANFAYDSHLAPRRSIYLPVVRSALFEFFQVFDFADPSALKGERTATVVPTQALFLLNGKLIDDAAIALAKRVRPKTNQPDQATLAIQEIFNLSLGRMPKNREITEILGFLNGNSGDAWHSLARALLSSNEFLYLD